MILVLDTSAAIEVVLARPGAVALRSTIANAELTFAPDLFVAEVTNVFWKYYKMASLPITFCEEGLRDAVSLIDQFVPGTTLSQEVFAASCVSQHPAYDLFFVVLARRLGATLISLDKRLINCAKKLGVKITDASA